MKLSNYRFLHLSLDKIVKGINKKKKIKKQLIKKTNNKTKKDIKKY